MRILFVITKWLFSFRTCNQRMGTDHFSAVSRYTGTYMSKVERYPGRLGDAGTGPDTKVLN